MSGEENLTGKINDNNDKDRRRRDRRQGERRSRERRKEQIPVEHDRRKGGDRRLNA